MKPPSVSLQNFFRSPNARSELNYRAVGGAAAVGLCTSAQCHYFQLEYEKSHYNTGRLGDCT